MPKGVYERPERYCSVIGCAEPHYGRGWCRPHWWNWRAYGDPLGRPQTAEEWFWSKVDRDGAIPEYAPHLGPCWWWMGTLTPNGYGKVTRQQVPAHRRAYELEVGPILEGMEIDHLCRVRRCVRPSHLEAVTPKENQHRGFGVAGLNARKTHCPQGHPYSGPNLIITAVGSRMCRTCSTERQRRKRAERRVNA